MCLLVACVFKKHKQRKNSRGEDYSAAAATGFVHCCCFSTAPTDLVCWTQSTMESRFVLSHMDVQICLINNFHFASRFFFFYRYAEKNYLKVKLKHGTILEHFVLSEFEFYSARYRLQLLSVSKMCCYRCMHACISPYPVTS